MDYNELLRILEINRIQLMMVCTYVQASTGILDTKRALSGCGRPRPPVQRLWDASWSLRNHSSVSLNQTLTWRTPLRCAPRLRIYADRPGDTFCLGLIQVLSRLPIFPRNDQPSSRLISYCETVDFMPSRL